MCKRSIRKKRAFKTCPICGANLDPAEMCDCENENPYSFEALQRKAKKTGGRLEREWDRENQEFIYILTEKSGRIICGNSKSYLYNYLNGQLALCSRGEYAV